MKNLEKFGLSFGDRVVVKVGSNILAGNSDGINESNIKNIVKSVSYLMGLGLNVLLVSSGAVAIGKNNHEKIGIKYEKDLSKKDKAYLFKNGWASLIRRYLKLFEEQGILAGGNLLTHDNFKNKEELRNIIETWEENVKNKTIDVINENDVVSREELGFSDNDELAGLVAEAFKADALIIFSDIDGVYKDFGTINQNIIKEVNNIDNVQQYCINSKDTIGTGGMKSKLTVMGKMMNIGIIGILVNGGKKNIIQKIFEGKDINRTIFIGKNS